jgi:hypothetical protein
VNRRELIKACAGVGVGIAAGFTGSALVPVRRWGAVTVERHRALCAQGIHLHVFLDGWDVTRDCKFADDTGDGMAELFLTNAEGKRYIVHGEFEHRAVPTHLQPRVATMVVHGVTISEGEPF